MTATKRRLLILTELSLVLLERISPQSSRNCKAANFALRSLTVNNNNNNIKAPTTMSSSSEDVKAAATGLFMLGVTSFALSDSVSLLSMLNGFFQNKEDTVWTKIPPFSYITPPAEKCITGAENAPDVVMRAKHAHRNHTENAVMLGAFYLVYAWSGADSETCRNLIYLSAGLRILFGPLYILKLAPWRTISYLVSSCTGVYVGYIGITSILKN